MSKGKYFFFGIDGIWENFIYGERRVICKGLGMEYMLRKWCYIGLVVLDVLLFDNINYL